MAGVKPVGKVKVLKTDGGKCWVWIGKTSQSISKEAESSAFKSLGKKEEMNINGSEDLELERFKNSPDDGAQ